MVTKICFILVTNLAGVFLSICLIIDEDAEFEIFRTSQLFMCTKYNTLFTFHAGNGFVNRIRFFHFRFSGRGLDKRETSTKPTIDVSKNFKNVSVTDQLSDLKFKGDVARITIKSR